MVRKIGSFIEVRAKVVEGPEVQYVRASEIQRVIPKTWRNQLVSTNLRNGRTGTVQGCTLKLIGFGFPLDTYESPEEVLAACNSILALEIMGADS